MVVFGSDKAHVHVLITVAIHGNEFCGVDAVNQLIKERFFSIQRISTLKALGKNRDSFEVLSNLQVFISETESSEFFGQCSFLVE